MTPVMAIGTRRNNAELIADCATLGYIHGNVLDATYGLGRFWTLHRPDNLTAIDINPARGVTTADFRHLPFETNRFDSTTLDPPYKLNGTGGGKGPATSDDDYGVADRYVSIADRHRLIIDGITECVRVTSGHLLVKCQDQVCSGRVQWQTRLFADHAETLGCRLVDMLHVQGHRQQPAGRRQLHARRDYSTALVLEVPS